MIFLLYVIEIFGILALSMLMGALLWGYSLAFHDGRHGRELFELSLGAGLVLLALVLL